VNRHHEGLTMGKVRLFGHRALGAIRTRQIARRAGSRWRFNIDRPGFLSGRKERILVEESNPGFFRPPNQKVIEALPANHKKSGPSYRRVKGSSNLRVKEMPVIVPSMTGERSKGMSFWVATLMPPPQVLPRGNLTLSKSTTSMPALARE